MSEGKSALIGYQLREAARNNLPTSLALPFDRLRERSMGKLFPGGSLKPRQKPSRF
jgi:hypothetical protein